MKEQMTKLQGSLRERENSNQELDMAIDQMKRSNLELELTAKEKEVLIVGIVLGHLSSLLVASMRFRELLGYMWLYFLSNNELTLFLKCE